MWHVAGRQVILAGPKCRMPGPEVSYRYEAQFSGLQVLSQTITAWDTQYRLSTQRCSMRLEIVPSRNTEQTCSSLTASDRTAVYFANKLSWVMIKSQVWGACSTHIYLSSSNFLSSIIFPKNARDKKFHQPLKPQTNLEFL